MAINLWVAAADNELETVQKFLASGDYTANSKDPNGYTPIHAAASYGHIDLLRYLLSQGGDINIQDAEGDTPLHHVEDVDTARILVEELKANHKLKNAEGQTAAEYIEEDDEFPDVAQYLRSLVTDAEGNTESILAGMPAAGTVGGHDIRYTYENNNVEVQTTPEEDAERMRKLEAIANSENPEEALRELVKDAVHQRFQELRAEPEESRKKRK
ncbi:hypothetical protein BABINDRAFT_159063 [Babjeviella inositovora NRRL Y-12698]|uniref:Uncharacterized protein n=1 Tax=Babjeviella inositovora NRRL Y-12698 TaxID=984486 RepID=A0A1E3QXU1_9ASCO|nr:uncharacterized protein BABINDRAFT_159063 [Babjeviella inositovora NRRL Y-12698]ODQ82483.1 hypothetical protein BABINDRAFT_159063 [Babjeviella inositovora NRRL Y-12698]